jgi:hypothetical protein
LYVFVTYQLAIWDFHGSLGKKYPKWVLGYCKQPPNFHEFQTKKIAHRPAGLILFIHPMEGGEPVLIGDNIHDLEFRPR